MKNLLKEIERIAQNTQWNGGDILDGTVNGTSGTVIFQVGANGGQLFSPSILVMRVVLPWQQQVRVLTGADSLLRPRIYPPTQRLQRILLGPSAVTAIE